MGSHVTACLRAVQSEKSLCTPTGPSSESPLVEIALYSASFVTGG
jgi:hypothetical protein